MKVIFKSPSKTVNHFQLKNVLPIEPSSGIIHNSKFNSRNVIYFGKTKRYFYVRAVEQMGILKLTNKCFEKVKQSVISDHLLTCDSHINFSGFIILSKDANNFHLLIKESLLIAGDKPILKKIG